jgi:hypothetical protein
VLRYLRDPWFVFWIVSFLGLWLFWGNTFYAFGIGESPDNKTDFFSFFVFGPMPMFSVWFCPLLYPIYGSLLLLKQRLLLLASLILHHSVWIACLYRSDLIPSDLKPSISRQQLDLVFSDPSTYLTLLPQMVFIQGLLFWHVLTVPKISAAK